MTRLLDRDVIDQLIDVTSSIVKTWTSRKESVTREFVSSGGIRKELTKALHVKQFEETEENLTEALTALFEKQIKDATSRLFSMGDGIATNSEKLVDQVFNPGAYDGDLVDLALPVLAEAMGEAAIATLELLGVNTSKAYKSPLDAALGPLNGTLKAPRLGTGSTGSQWLESSGQELPPGLASEFPQWMKDRIGEQLRATFEQDYWTSINDTTKGNLEVFLRNGIENGWSIRDMANGMVERFPSDYSKARATAVARTESGHALNGARKLSVDQLKAEVPEVPMKQEWLSVLGFTTRDAHADLDGVPEDEEGLWNLNGVMVRWPSDTSLPPADRVNCQCHPPGQLVTGKFIAGSRSFYDGWLIELVTQSGRVLHTTPNHPILTAGGFTSAESIKKGDDLFCMGSMEQPLTSIEKIQNKPRLIEDVFESLKSFSSVVEKRWPLTFEFHGDAASFIGEVEMVSPYSILSGESISQQSSKMSLAVANSQMSSSHPFVNIGSRGVLPSSYLSVGVVPNIDAKFLETFCKNTPRRFMFNRQGNQSSSRNVLGSDLLDIRQMDFTPRRFPSSKLRLGSISNFACNPASDDVFADTEDSAYRGKGLSAFIERDKVVGVKEVIYSGHVYDLQTLGGWYTVANIIASNCTITTSFGMSDEEARQLINEHSERIMSDEGGEPAIPESPEIAPAIQPEMRLDQALEQTAQELQPLDKERLVVFNKDGTVAFTQDGVQDAVDLSANQMKQMEGRISLHNHPADAGGSVTSFSGEDIRGAVQRNEFGTHVISQQGHRFQMGYGQTLEGLTKKQRFDLAEKVGTAYDESLRKQAKIFSVQIKKGAITQNEAVLRVSDRAWKTVAEEFGFVYKGL